MNRLHPRRTYTSVDIELDDFDKEQLLQALIDANWLSEEEATAIALRASRKSKDKISVISDGAISEEYQIACDEMRSGRKHEAIVHVERYLGREWIGKLQ
jgi:hypothetical protein